MIYKTFQNEKISALGLGCMRLPSDKDDYSKIDQQAVQEMVDYAFSKGINYFDTAWGYHEGNSEYAIGKALSKYPRESFFLADKFPGYDLDNMDKVEEIFEKQLKKCQVDYFDFYLFHNVNELNIDAYLDPKYGIYDYLIKQKRNGRIKHLGCSTHGTLETMRRFLDAYGKDLEFCMIQLNWLDWTIQSAKEKVDLINEYGLPVWVMEPVRGGKLASLEPEYESAMRKVNATDPPVKWAFRFIQSIPEIVVTLSGMSNFDQLKENIDIFENTNPLNADEKAVLSSIVSDMTAKKTLPCTYCRYCIHRCPMELDIPYIIKQYNEYSMSNGGFIPKMAIDALPENKRPNACLGCRACESVCPQNITISEMMSDLSKKLKL